MSALFKNVASQDWKVFAFDATTSLPVTGDALNITANIAKDRAAAVATNDINPTETEDGYYLFNLTQAESNADILDLYPASATANVVVVGSPATQLTTPANFPDSGITATGGYSINWGDVENPTTSVNLSATTINLVNTATTLTSQPGNFSDLAITAGTGRVDVGEWLGIAVATPTVGGVPEVDITHLAGDLTSGDNLKNQFDGVTGVTGGVFPATQDQVSGLSVGSSAISVVATSFSLTTGSVASGTITDTETLNGVSHVLNDALGVIDAFYEFDVGPDGVPVSITWDGFITGINDATDVFAFNWGGASWDQLGTIPGQIGAGNINLVFDLLTRHVGSGGNDGLVRFRFDQTGLTTAAINTDRISCAFTQLAGTEILDSGMLQAATVDTATLKPTSDANNGFFTNARLVTTGGTGDSQERVIVDYDGTTKVATIKPSWVVTPDATTEYSIFPSSTHVATQDLGYETGQIYIDTNGSNTGILVQVDGTADNPVNNLADANTLLTLAGLKAFHIIPGSSIVLNQTYTNFEFFGRAGIIDFGNQIISGSITEAHFVNGIINPATTNSTFQQCLVLSAGLTTPNINMFNCSFGGNLTLTASGTYNFINCSSVLPNGTSPVINVQGDGLTARNVNVRQYAGGIEIQNLSSVDAVSLTGDGIVTLNVNCTGGTLFVSGDFELIDNSGSVTITDDARYAQSQILSDAVPFLGADIPAIKTDTGAILADTADMQPKLGTPVTTVSGDIASVQTDTTQIIADIAALNNISVGDILAGGDVDGFTLEESLKLVLASAAAKLSGAATTTVIIRAADDSKDRITATVDVDGNRSAVVLDGTG
jgi:hypothetical protein